MIKQTYLGSPITATLLFVLLFSTPALRGCLSSSVKKDEKIKEATESQHLHSKAGQLSDKDHIHKDGNADEFGYDHDAFLGKDEAEEFDVLEPEESKRRLGLIVDKIDGDKDGFVTQGELQLWIKLVHDKYVMKNAEDDWKRYGGNSADGVSWDGYKKVQHEGGEDDEAHELSDKHNQRRWNKADANGDKLLNKIELQHFLQPEEFDHMQDIVVEETLEEMDKDGDGFVSLKEYIGDLHGSEDDEGPIQGDDEEWTAEMATEFRRLDIDDDGKMNNEEIRMWIRPINYVIDEARHLIEETDQDSDKKLTKAEILQNHEHFVGSKATEFGELLHEEL